MSIGEESNPIVNLMIGLVIGVGLSFLYIRFGIEMPSAVGVGQRLTSEAIVKTAEFELLNQGNSQLVRHRALAMILSQKPDTFLEVDQSIGNRFFNAYLHRHQMENSLYGSGLVDESRNESLTISRSKVGTTFVNPGVVIQSADDNNKSNSEHLVDALLRQKYPGATDEIIKFLVEHPETRTQSLRIGRETTLPGLQLTR